MKKQRVLVLLLAAALAGCSTADVSGRASSFASSAAPPAGTSVSGGSAGIVYPGAPAAGVIVTTAVIAAMLGMWRDAPQPRAAPELLEGRAINEADCSQPIEDWSKNLKCR